MLALVEQYASGITTDTSALEQAVGQLDASNFEDLTSSLEGGLFETQKTPEQLATLERLETMLALVEDGWTRSSPRRPLNGCPPRPLWPRLCAGLVPPEVRPRRRSPRWWDLSCGRAGCVMLQTCGRRCATPGQTAGTPSGRIPTSCPHQLILTIHWALSPETRTEGEETGDFDTALEELLKGESTEGDENPNS